MKIGYSGLRNQQLGPKGLPDLKESFYISEDTDTSGNLYPPEDLLPGFREATSTYYKAMIILSQKLFRMLALGLGQVEDYFDHYSGADGTFSITFGSTLRPFHYSPSVTSPEGEISCGAHTDFGTSECTPASLFSSHKR